MSPLVVFSPAKINLFLAVTGRRPDGYHDLVSVAAPLEIGDTLWLEPAAEFSLECDDTNVPTGEANLVLRAARLFVEATGWGGGVKFFLQKRLPMGAGLGGGSSNAAAALRGLNVLAGEPLDAAALSAVAARAGSDCALFLAGRPVVMRGRGERIEPLAEAAARRLRGRRVLLFKPGFSISTPWAYAQLAAAETSSSQASTGKPAANYLPAAEAEGRFAAWQSEESAPIEKLLFNSLESPAFRKFPALAMMLEALTVEFGLAARMSGSGSACFALLPEGVPIEPVCACVRTVWGTGAWIVETKIL
ncbi:MAG: 4-(cytidine 5'-diphospho)-2-C-methyl-D-erythritol kinase [Verrucomicrobiota bacterium]|nr:4-(cytidine 5'-diphospho)-2-C-methyl-D-erythritol kinase [Verrucomicrobiota bacterium]